MHERDANDNSNERMADRPPIDDTAIDPVTSALDDVSSEGTEPTSIDDV